MARPIREKQTAGNETRARLIEVAASHFARHGYDAASQRAVQREAGVNPASAHYHFGSKEAMYRAVVETFIHDIQKERLERLRQPKLPNPQEQLRKLLYDYFEPSLMIGQTALGFNYLNILARLSSETMRPAREIFEGTVRTGRDLYVRSLRDLFPDADEVDIREALAMGVTLMATMLTRRGPDSHFTSEQHVQRDARRLAEFVAAGFESWFGQPVSRVSG